MLDYVQQVARELRTTPEQAWAMIRGGEGGASTPPPVTGQPAMPQQPMQPLSSQAPGRRDRAAEVAQSINAMRPPSPNTGLMAELNKIMAEKDKPQATLGGWALRKAGLIPEDSTSATLGEAVFKGLGDAFGSTDEKDKAVKAATKGVNEFAPVSVAEQMVKKKRPTLGTSLASLFMGPQSTQTAQAQPTAGSSLFKMLGFG
jgi:hypothetical protein